MTPSILDFLKTFGINTKTNFDLKDYARDLNLKIKILMNDELLSLEGPLESPLESPLEKETPMNIIINYQNSNEKGSHWVCIHEELCEKKIYFDPFGIKPTKEVEDYLSGDLSEGYIFNSLQVQPWNTKICGVLCLYVLYRLTHGEEDSREDFESIIQEIYNDLKSLL